MAIFIKSKNDTKKMMLNVLIALVPIILFSIYKNGYLPYTHNKTDLFGLFYPLIFILVGSLTSLIAETIYALITKKKGYFKRSYGFMPGLFLSLILPLKTPILILIAACLVATIIGKLIFGGFGKNIFNPALIGYVFMLICFSNVFSTNNYLNNYELDTISKATPLTNASFVTGIGSYDELVKPYGSLSNFFIGTIPGAIGEVSALLCLVAFIYLTLTKTIKWKISVTYVATVFIITYIIGRLLGQGVYYPLFHILSGGLMFGAVFMATDPVTSAVTPIGQVLQGLLLGISTVILRFLGVEGVAISILFVNMLVFLLDKIGAKARFNFLKAILYFILICIIILASGVILASGKRSDKKDPNFEIISKEKNNNQIIYVVNQKGYAGNIKGEIILENKKVVSFKILKHHESKDRYELILKEDYLSKLITNQTNLDNIDTISSATITSNALKRMLNNVLLDN